MKYFLKTLCVLTISSVVAYAQTPGGGALTPEQLAAGENTYTDAPTLGAWWHTGKLPAGTTDLTGVWFGGASGDLSENTLPGQEMILTPLGYERYKNVDHATDPNAFCLPPGPARMFMMAHPGMIVQRPDVVAILSESQRTFRLIYTDGRGHHPEAWDYPEWMGSSIGKWEGDTLVVETIAINDRTWLDTSGHEHSNKLKLTERFRLADPNTLEHIVTYDDDSPDLPAASRRSHHGSFLPGK
jgi:hypothetical protein